jgi:hypothetical protein
MQIGVKGKKERRTNIIDPTHAALFTFVLEEKSNTKAV